MPCPAAGAATPNTPEAAVEADGWLYVSGQAPMRDGEVVEGGIVEQTRIAFEKAGIAKPGVPLVSQHFNYEQPAIAGAIEDVAERIGAPLFQLGGKGGWGVGTQNGQLTYHDWQGDGGTREDCTLPLPGIPGRHQIENAGLAIAMLRHQRRVVGSIGHAGGTGWRVQI